MKLQFAGAPEVAAPLATVWACLLDPQFVAGSTPGVESVEVVDATHSRLRCSIGFGAFRVQFALDVKLEDAREPSHARMRATGSASGSTVDVASAIDLEPIDARRTRLGWRAECEFGGTLAALGPRLVEGAARVFTERFWNDFAQRVGTQAA